MTFTNKHPIATAPSVMTHGIPNTVVKVTEAKLPTKRGAFQIAGYRSVETLEEFICIFKGDMLPDVPTLVRIHSQCLTGDVFGSTKCDCGPQLERALDLIADEGRGAVVYQLQEGRGIGIINKIRAYALQDEGADTIQANEMLGFEVDLREYSQCVEILRDLGLIKVKAMSNNPDKLRAMKEGGLELLERVPIEVKPSNDALFYLQTKKLKMGHMIELIN